MSLSFFPPFQEKHAKIPLANFKKTYQFGIGCPNRKMHSTVFGIFASALFFRPIEPSAGYNYFVIRAPLPPPKKSCAVCTLLQCCSVADKLFDLEPLPNNIYLAPKRCSLVNSYVCNMLVRDKVTNCN